MQWTELDAATRRYQASRRAKDVARDRVVAAALEALRAGARPTDVVAHSPFTAAYVRRLARENGIGPQ